MGMLARAVGAKVVVCIAVLSAAQDRRAAIAEVLDRAAAEGGDRLRSECHCMCPIHENQGRFCRPGDRPILVVLTGGLKSPVAVPMCGPCAGWWQDVKPDRIAATHTW